MKLFMILCNYTKGDTFDLTKHNYLILNYEKFQQAYSEVLYQDLTKNNAIDFIVTDEVHNAKQRKEGEESIRRGVLTSLIGRARKSNKKLCLLAMSATPVINELSEAKSLLQMLTGLEYEKIKTTRSHDNALQIFQQLLLNGLRYIPKYDINVKEFTGLNTPDLDIDGTHLMQDLLKLTKSNIVGIEKVLLKDKLRATQKYLRSGVIIYSHYTDDAGILDVIAAFVKSQGFSCGVFSGASPEFRGETLKSFIAGDIDILIASDPITTGVDGLQKVCDRMILITLPWTDATVTQLKGRIYRQGSNFGETGVDFIIPQIRIPLDRGAIWSWDAQRLNLIKSKRTLADAAVDGLIPSKRFPSQSTLFNKSIESLKKWKDRINSGHVLSRLTAGNH